MATEANADDPTVESLTSSAKVQQKVEWIIETGADTEILDDGYERRQAIQRLRDHASHPNADSLVVERAEDAIEQLSEELSGGDA